MRILSGKFCLFRFEFDLRLIELDLNANSLWIDANHLRHFKSTSIEEERLLIVIVKTVAKKNWNQICN